MLTAREEIAQIITELTPPGMGADYLRGVESWLEELNWEHGPHSLLTAALNKISSRIVFLEIGEVKGES